MKQKLMITLFILILGLCIRCKKSDPSSSLGEKPSAPILTSPVNGSTDVSTSLTFSWNASNEAVSYRIQIASDSLLTSIAMNKDNITNTSTTVNTLSVLTTYFWRVNSSNANGTSSWSDVWKFTTSLTGDEIVTGELYVDIYDQAKACEGTTLFADLHDLSNPRIVEVDMQGNIIWEYDIPDNLKQYHSPGLDVEQLNNDNILFVLPGNGVYEIDRNKNIVWSHLDDKISHDADRLINNRLVYVYGYSDTKNDPQMKEINQQGQTIWSWYAINHFDVAPYDTISRQGWVHTNAVTRMNNGNTLINLRNFNQTVEVNPLDSIVWFMDWGTLYPSASPIGFDPHEPEMLPDNHLLVCLQWDTPYQIVEIDRSIKQPVWEYHRDNLRTCRDADRLPNGNTLIVGVLEETQDSVIFEITQNGEIVWQLKVKDTPATGTPGWFYKAQRIVQ